MITSIWENPLVNIHRKVRDMIAALVIGLTLSTMAYAQAGRDYVYVVGSSTVYPFATVVAERFGRGSEFKTPKIESTGSGGGLKLFCDGVGVDYPDIANSSRAIKSSEVETCAAKGVTEIVEVKIGYDGIVFANAVSAKTMKLSRADIFLALASLRHLGRCQPGPAGGKDRGPRSATDLRNTGCVCRTRNGRWLQGDAMDRCAQEFRQESLQGNLPHDP
jgi:hypothetical protein